MTMALPAQDLYDAALELSENERLDLAARLLASIDGPADDDWDAAWLAELDRRERAAALFLLGQTLLRRETPGENAV